MEAYDPAQIEAKWQAEWLKSNLYAAGEGNDKPKFYSLVEFPFPSGDGLHVGHIRSYTALDIVARKHRMMGQNVLYPIGWDAFGLPTENYALKTGKAPQLVTQENTDNFRRQLQSLGVSFDWSREINTTDPAYYKWTQWIFLQLYKKGLAYKQKTLINWCPKDKIGLANEEVIDGKCERCGTAVEQKEKEQWILAITKYADRLVDDLATVDYPERVKAQQRNWIGRSEGALIKFDDLEVFTTRPETIYGATYVAIAGKTDRDTGKKVKNPATGELIPVWEAEYVMEGVGTGAVMGVPAHDERDFVFATRNGLPVKHVVAPQMVDKDNPPREGKKNTEREIIHAIVLDPTGKKFIALKNKTQPWLTPITGGVENGEDVLAAAEREIREETGYQNVEFVSRLSYRMFVEFYAAHKDVNRAVWSNLLQFRLKDLTQKDLSPEEASKHDVQWLPLSDMDKLHPVAELEHILAWVVSGHDIPYCGHGLLINSGQFNGKDSVEAREDIIKFVGGKKKTTYKLRDWIFSRQRYWGDPIPMIWCDQCEWQPVPEDQLPVTLPEVKNYQPRDDGESPLASISEWVNVKCPQCGGEARRETDVMPNWAGSSWYYLRYTDPHNNQAFASPEKLKYWVGNGVDWYNGGMEHTTLHLLYSRFWHKFLFDQGLVPTSEPYAKRTSHGLIMAEDGEKMSKSRGNVVNPDKIIQLYGADTLRLYEMFMGPFEQAVAWSTESIIGPRRFIEKVWRLADKVKLGAETDAKLEKLLNESIKKVGEDIETLGFNTAVSQLMILANALQNASEISAEVWRKFLAILYPFTPHLAEELWSKLGENQSLQLSAWPEFSIVDNLEAEVAIMVQVSGVVRERLQVLSNLDQSEVEKVALQSQKVQKWLDGKEVKKVVWVPGKLINFVV